MSSASSFASSVFIQWRQMTRNSCLSAVSAAIYENLKITQNVNKMSTGAPLNTEENVKPKIILTLLNGTGYIFDADDYMQLRKEHRIVGSLVGTCSTRGWSASESMLPVELSRCETQLLLEQQLAILVSKQQSLLDTPLSSADLAVYSKNFEHRIAEQAAALKAEKLRETERNMTKVLAGKSKKLLAAGVPLADIHLDAGEILKEIGDNLSFERKNALLQIHCAHAEAHTAKIVRLPVDRSLKYRVFCDFWHQGKFVTSGEAFGADFLLYPGDPLLYHASHIVVLLHEPCLQPLRMIAKVRLSVIVNKICIFAYFGKTYDLDVDGVDAELPPLCYQTVLWEGNRARETTETNASTS